MAAVADGDVAVVLDPAAAGGLRYRVLEPGEQQQLRGLLKKVLSNVE
jgi:hypothetical protein